MRLQRLFSDLSVRKKLILIYSLTAVIILVTDIIVYLNVYNMVTRIDNVFESNISLSELSVSLDGVQTAMTDYLKRKSTDNMDSYYKAYQDYYDKVSKLSDEISSESSKRMERNIRTMSDKYLEVTDDAIEAKRGRNIEKYRGCYETAVDLYGYLNAYISSLNNEMLSTNSGDYLTLTRSFNYIGMANILVFFWIVILNILLVVVVVNRITRPLATLAKAAEQVADGDYDVVIADTNSKDEPGILITAFNRMLLSIKNGVVTEAKLHEAQLRFLQAQINPHFLFNTLNAGAQLAMMEDAKKTYRYIQNVADFFRYNIKKQDVPVSLSDELKMVDTYIYIINIRFAGEVGYEKEVDDDLLTVKIPTMTLQPIVENAVSHGIRDISYPGVIKVSIKKEDDKCRIDISDNGVGMSEETIEKILSRRAATPDEEELKEHSGIGLNNVIARLRLLYGEDVDVFDIESEGNMKGTTVTLKLPIEE